MAFNTHDYSDYHVLCVLVKSNGSYRNMKEPSELISIAEAARRLGLRPITVRLWAAQRKLARVRLGRRVLIPAEEISRLVERNTIPALPERSR
jgi:excisionase family DNA binding protein